MPRPTAEENRPVRVKENIYSRQRVTVLGISYYLTPAAKNLVWEAYDQPHLHHSTEEYIELVRCYREGTGKNKGPKGLKDKIRLKDILDVLTKLR